MEATLGRNKYVHETYLNAPKDSGPPWSEAPTAGITWAQVLTMVGVICATMLHVIETILSFGGLQQVRVCFLDSPGGAQNSRKNHSIWRSC